MRIILMAFAGLVGLILVLLVVVAIVGALLPRNHEASRSLVLNAPPEEVFRVIADFEHAATWRRDIQRTEILGSVNGHLRFREHRQHGATTYDVLRQEPPRILVTEIVDRDLGYSGSWTFSLVPEEGGTRLTIEERGEVSNVIFRFMSRYVLDYTRTMDTYLTYLSQHLAGLRKA
jgi:uncharacterized protein YndB with AHSA1/START domain